MIHVRGNEGEFRLSCRFTGMAGSELIRGQSSESWAKQELECSSLLMKLIKDAKIVDTESLCVVTGEKVIADQDIKQLPPGVEDNVRGRRAEQ